MNCRFWDGPGCVKVCDGFGVVTVGVPSPKFQVHPVMGQLFGRRGVRELHRQRAGAGGRRRGEPRRRRLTGRRRRRRRERCRRRDRCRRRHGRRGGCRRRGHGDALRDRHRRVARNAGVGSLRLAPDREVAVADLDQIGGGEASGRPQIARGVATPGDRRRHDAARRPRGSGRDGCRGSRPGRVRRIVRRQPLLDRPC